MAPKKMPPKKGGDGPKQPPLIGRFGTSLKIGIVGLPNVGKSTFFNVLTKSQAAAENFPFCTIDPNESRVPIPDERFDFLCQYHKPASKVPAFLNVVDIAGLVKGAHAGQGLGNAFLSNIFACDAIFHMTREYIMIFRFEFSSNWGWAMSTKMSNVKHCDGLWHRHRRRR
nr:obg-like ATPase 1 [Danio rerio]|eukprot:XP_021326651.1 obg-like ATPase 1 [Danio rerio]